MLSRKFVRNAKRLVVAWTVRARAFWAQKGPFGGIRFLQNKALFWGRYRRHIRLFAVLGGVSFVAACTTSQDGAPSMFVGRCMPERADIVNAMDWTNVQPTTVRIVNGEIRPMVMYFEQNRAYILEVTNADRVNHDMWAPEFFKQAVALDSLQFDDKTPAKGCVNGVRIKARSTVKIRFVPVWEGRYLVNNSTSFIHAPTGPDAVAYVIPPRIGVASR